ncbi:MAG TPA: hypothetical protein PKD55_00995 [Bellilinea sp.]|nr:hypothetical protein [Bellilinea sp.]
MARTYRAALVGHIRAMEARFNAEAAERARQMAPLVLRAAAATQDGVRTIPNTRRAKDDLKNNIWSLVVRRYYVGAGDDAFDGTVPLSPFANLLYDGIAGSVRLAAEQQVALLERHVRDRRVLMWLTGPRPYPLTEQRGHYDPFHQWVDPAGYRLSDRVWRAGIDERARIDRLLDYHISQGTEAVDIADLLEDYLTPGARLIRTRTPYGREGSYAARRLARTEITAAAGRATINASRANPFVAGMRWTLSGSHPEFDICDQNATGGPNGDGVYPVAETPIYPAHPHCLCNLQPQPVGNTRDMVNRLRAEIRAASPRARALQGVFGVEFLVGALLSGSFDDVIAATS